MKVRLESLLTLCMLAGFSAPASRSQAGAGEDPSAAALRQFYNGGKRNIIRSAEKMPEANYAFQPAPEVRTFAQLVAHIADGQYLLCSAIKGEVSPIGSEIGVLEKSKTTKTEIEASLKASFEYCDPMFAAAKDSDMGQKIQFFGREQNKAVPFTLVISHMWEHYGNMVTYLRMKGIVPASSEQQPAPAAKPEEKPAQQASQAKEEMPGGWKMRLDDEAHDKAAPRFWTMPPGWHITSGPAAIYYDPQQVAGGDYRLDSESFLFPPGELNEGYGFFFGGKDLHNQNIRYTYFLIRRDGSYLIKQRNGAQTKELVPWTASPAIVKHDKNTDVTAKNQLAIETRGNSVDFFVNGQRVHTLTRTQAPTEGIVGLRVNHRVNAHITYLTIKPRGASARKIEQEVTVAGSVQDVWNAWTTVPGVTSFFGPGADLELKPGGKYEIFFDINDKKQGCNGCTVIAFEPQKRLQYTWNAPPNLKNVRPQYSRVTLTFSRMGAKSTRVRMVHDEWGTGGEWDQAYAYFQQAWPAVLSNLQYRFAKGPVEWKDGRFTRAAATN